MSGFVYFISYGETGWIKIGYATSVKSRLQTLQCSSPENLTVEATIPSNRPGEGRLHHILSAFRGNREWFRPSNIVLGLIKEARAGCSIDEACAWAEARMAERAAERSAIALDQMLLGLADIANNPRCWDHERADARRRLIERSEDWRLTDEARAFAPREWIEYAHEERAQFELCRKTGKIEDLLMPAKAE